MTCFFDPSHAPGSASVLWSPQWGVPRPVQACGACAQRVQTTAPPYYMPSGAPQGAGYPQQPGYPQQGYPQPGYPPQRQGHSTGAVVGAGVAGLVGGALLDEMLSDRDRDQPREVVENNVYEERDGRDGYDGRDGFDNGFGGQDGYDNGFGGQDDDNGGGFF